MSAAGTPSTPPPVPGPEPQLAGSIRRCLDCGAPLESKFCGECGQRGQLRSLSLRTLTHDALHDLAHLDSRVWRTLRALLLRPGFLTNEFLAGRRTRYLPPFRLYLVLSVIFFVLPSCDAPDDIVLDGKPVAGNRAGVVTAGDHPALRQAAEELQREFELEAKSAAAGGDTAERAAVQTAATVARHAAQPGAVLALDADCQNATWGLPGRSWMEPLIKDTCEHLKTVSKREFGRALIGNVPKMLFLSLPLLALVNVVLYAFQRRKYVEHLLFYVHFHAFVFLLLTLQLLLVSPLEWVGLDSVAELVTLATVILLFVVLFKAMRAVYRQSRAMTWLKYVLVLSSYGVCSLLTLIGTMIYTAVTV